MSTTSKTAKLTQAVARDGYRRGGKTRQLLSPGVFPCEQDQDNNVALEMFQQWHRALAPILGNHQVHQQTVFQQLSQTQHPTNQIASPKNNSSANRPCRSKKHKVSSWYEINNFLQFRDLSIPIFHVGPSKGLPHTHRHTHKTTYYLAQEFSTTAWPS